MGENAQAAVFDFDGIIFQPGSKWKIRNPQIGVLGTRIPWEDACLIFEKILAVNPQARLSEFYLLNEYSLIAESEFARGNLQPLDSVMKAARSHVGRKQDLFFLSSRSYRDLNEFTEQFMKPEDQRSGPNPFLASKLLFPPYEPISAETFRNVENKFRLLTGMLRTVEDPNPPEAIYQKIFLYYTETEYESLISSFLQKNLDRLEGGRNAIVPMMMAELR